MCQTIIICISTLLAALLPAIAEPVQTPLSHRSLSDLEKRSGEIDTQLAKLANYSLNGGIGAIGYRSESYPDETHSEWIEIRFADL
jgi:hypothetical protein